MNNSKYITGNRRLIAGIGSALVDILIHEKDEFLVKIEAAKGGMTLVGKNDIERIRTLSSAKPR